MKKLLKIATKTPGNSGRYSKIFVSMFWNNFIKSGKVKWEQYFLQSLSLIK